MLMAMVTITCALLFYTIGVWSEQRALELKKWHLFIFWLGFAFDTMGTIAMGNIVRGGFQLDFHGISGLLAILFMLVHVLWATYVLVKNDEAMKVKFHQLSMVVWTIWLVPYISGMVFGMMSGISV